MSKTETDKKCHESFNEDGLRRPHQGSDLWREESHRYLEKENSGRGIGKWKDSEVRVQLCSSQRKRPGCLERKQKVGESQQWGQKRN